MYLTRALILLFNILVLNIINKYFTVILGNSVCAVEYEKIGILKSDVYCEYLKMISGFNKKKPLAVMEIKFKCFISDIGKHCLPRR